MTELNQRHHLVLLFTDLTDSTRIAASLEPEQYAELLQQLRALTTTIIARHGGEIARIDGDGALCIFGYPLAHEDAGRRATEAALDLHAATAELATSMGGGSAINLHSGIHAGVVLLRSGDLVRGRYEMLGDATNVAARLCDQAGADGILVSESTLGSDRHFFTTGPVRQISLAGHRETMPALHILGREDVPHRFATREKLGLTPFVGRQKERSAVADWLAGSVPVMLVHGPAGIGKSRLLGQIASDAEARGYRILRGYCESYLGARPLQPLLQVAQGLGYDDAADGAIGPDGIGASFDRARGERLLVLIDDWQWADDASRDLIQRLIDDDKANDRRWLLFSRGEDSGLGPQVNAASLALPPLSSADAERAVANLLRSPDPFVTRRIEAAAGGSPLLIEELCHAFQASGKTPDKDPRGAWFDLAVQARFARLDPADGQLLREAAVIGHMVPGWLLAALRNEPVSGAVLGRLQAADFLFPGDSGDTLRFKHGLTRDAIYAGIGFNDRKALHTRVLAVLERRAEAQGEAALLDALAYHSAAAGAIGKALPYAIGAGDAALSRGALDRAQAHYKVAFDFLLNLEIEPRDLDQLRHVIKMFGRSCVKDPGREHVPLLENMLKLAERTQDAEAITLATYWIGAHYYGLGEPRRSLAMLERAYALVQSGGSESFLTQIEANLGQSNAIACRYDPAITYMDRAITKKWKAWRPGQPSPSLAYCISSHGLVLADMGRFDESERQFEESWVALAGAEDPIFASMETQRSLAFNWQGRHEEAIDRAQPAGEVARRIRSRAILYSARALESYARLRLWGEKRDLEDLVEVAASLLTIDQPQRLSYILGWVAEGLAERGEDAAARLFAKRTFECTFKGDRLGEASAARALATLAARSGGPRGFRKYLAHADRAAQHRLSAREAALNRVCEANCLYWSGGGAAAIAAAEVAAAACSSLDLQNWKLTFN